MAMNTRGVSLRISQPFLGSFIREAQRSIALSGRCLDELVAGVHDLDRVPSAALC